MLEEVKLTNQRSNRGQTYYTESTSTGGLNTFFGALKGGARHYFIIEEGGGKQKFEQPRRKISYWLNNRF